MHRTTSLAILLLAATTAAARGDPPPRKTLAECAAIAVAHHPDLRAAEASADAARQRTWQAVAGALPQIDAAYGVDRRRTSATARTGAQIAAQNANRSQTFNFYSAGVNLSQILFDFGQSLDAIRAARATEESLRADQETARETVLFNVKRSYFSLLTADRLLDVAENNVRQDQKHLDLAQARLDVGLATRFDVTQAQVQLAGAELARVTARRNASVARESLRNALGLDGPLDFDVVDTLDVHDVQIDEATALALAYDRRPELVSQRLQQQALTEQIAALQKSYLPNLTGDASYAYSGPDYPLQSSWNVGASVNLSLFNGGLTTAQIGEARANLAGLRSKERSLRQQIGLQVRQAVLDLAQALEAIRVSDKGRQQARENLALAEGRYATGVGNIIELTDAQASLATAQGNHVQALSNFKTAVAALEQATAQSLDEDAANRGAAPSR
ncbi:MAG: TolC family protein [Deltaproteobacteria bacterium]|nr:TolC family protein [Deltaproteobacteria bacterium]